MIVSIALWSLIFAGYLMALVVPLGEQVRNAVFFYSLGFIIMGLTFIECLGNIIELVV